MYCVGWPWWYFRATKTGVRAEKPTAYIYKYEPFKVMLRTIEHKFHKVSGISEHHEEWISTCLS